MKRNLACLFVLLLPVFFTACAAQQSATVEGFTFTAEEGYDFISAPLGSSKEEISEKLNCTLVSKAENYGGTHDPDHDAYMTQEFDAVDICGKKAGVEAVFDDGKLYDLSFVIRLEDGKEGEALYHETAESFKQTFGEPLKEQEQNGMVSALWRHEDNTQLLIQIVPVGESAIIQVGVADITLLSIE